MSTTWRAFIRGFKYIEKNDWAWIHAKVAVGVLCPLIAWLIPPISTRNGTIDIGVLHLVLLMLAFGGALSIIGLLLRGTRVKPLIVGYAFEMAGLIPLIAGPLFLSFIYLVSAGNSIVSLVGFAFTYALGAILLARYVDILVHSLMHQKGAGPLGNEGRT